MLSIVPFTASRSPLAVRPWGKSWAIKQALSVLLQVLLQALLAAGHVGGQELRGRSRLRGSGCREAYSSVVKVRWTDLCCFVLSDFHFCASFYLHCHHITLIFPAYDSRRSCTQLQRLLSNICDIGMPNHLPTSSCLNIVFLALLKRKSGTF